MKKKLMTLCIITEGERVLLGMKKRSHGAGKWNGFGGKVEKGETVRQAAIREVREECGIRVKKLEEMATLSFITDNDPVVLEVHVFRIDKFEGEPFETEEMRPRWFEADSIPYGQMWEEDKYWLQMFLKGKRFDATFRSDKDGKNISHEIKMKK